MWATLGLVLLADALDVIDATITNIAAPTIARELNGGESLIKWLGPAYMLAMGVLLVAGGRLGARKIGRQDRPNRSALMMNPASTGPPTLERPRTGPNSPNALASMSRLNAFALSLPIVALMPRKGLRWVP